MPARWAAGSSDCSQIRRSGVPEIGRTLLAHAQADAARRRLSVQLEVADNCSAAIALYRQLGWREVKRESVTWGGAHATCLLTFEALPGDLASALRVEDELAH